MGGLELQEMARKPRYESNNGLYHIIKRGNYHRDLFYAAKTKKAFKRTLIKACNSPKRMDSSQVKYG